MKRCNSCGLLKAFDEFYRRRDGYRDLYRSACKVCCKRSAEQKRKRRQLHAELPERHVREGLIQRCHNPNNPSFPNYGGRGIRVCQRWLDSFDAFLEDLGARPSPAHTVERIDNDKGYEPSNCRWATRKEQNRNTRQNVLLTIDGLTLCRAEWAERSGVSANLIRDRIQKLGWNVREAVFTPSRGRRRR